jgi:hypothetical protein
MRSCFGFVAGGFLGGCWSSRPDREGLLDEVVCRGSCPSQKSPELLQRSLLTSTAIHRGETSPLVAPFSGNRFYSFRLPESVNSPNGWRNKGKAPNHHDSSRWYNKGKRLSGHARIVPKLCWIFIAGSLRCRQRYAIDEPHKSYTIIPPGYTAT